MKHSLNILVGVIISLVGSTSSAFAIPTSTNKTVQTTGGRAAIGTPAPKSEPVKQAPVEAPATAPKAVEAPKVVIEEPIVSSESRKGPNCFRSLIGGEMRWGGLHRGEAHQYDEGFGGKLDVDIGCRMGMFLPGGALQLGGDPFRLLGTSRDFDLSKNVGYGQLLVGSKFFLTKRTWLQVQGGAIINAIGNENIHPQEFVGKLGSHIDANSWLNHTLSIEFISAHQISVENNLQFDLGPLYLGAIEANRLIYENSALAPVYLELGGEVGMKFDAGLNAHVGSTYSPTSDSFSVMVGGKWEIPDLD